MSSFWPDNTDLAHLDDDEQPDYLRQLHQLMALVDRAMGEEGIPAEVRDRVVSRVLHGEPTPDATRDWATPLPEDLAVMRALADAAPEPYWPPMNAAGL